jgi:hypothetical protein
MTQKEGVYNSIKIHLKEKSATPKVAILNRIVHETLIMPVFKTGYAMQVLKFLN